MKKNITIIILLSFTKLLSNETTINKNVKINKYIISEIPKCDKYISTNNYYAKDITLPLFDYPKKLIGTNEATLISEYRLLICKEKNNIIKIKSINILNVEEKNKNKIAQDKIKTIFIK